MKYARLTDEQRRFLAEISAETDGFGNGHCNFMFAGIPKDDLGYVLDVIRLSRNFLIPCEAKLVNDEKKDTVTLWLSTHDKYLPEDWLKYISGITSTVCYGASAWDNQANIMRYQKGTSLNFADTVVFVNEFLFNENSKGSDFYYDLDLAIKDPGTGELFKVGGGCIDRTTAIDIFSTLDADFAGAESDLIRGNFKDALTYCETGRELSSLLDYGFSDEDIANLAEIHRDNPSLRLRIENLLEDCNFHTESNDFKHEEYDGYLLDEREAGK